MCPQSSWLPWMNFCAGPRLLWEDAGLDLRVVLITRSWAEILTNVREAAKMSQCLAPQENMRSPHGVQRDNCHTLVPGRPRKRVCRAPDPPRKHRGHTPLSPSWLNGVRTFWFSLPRFLNSLFSGGTWNLSDLTCLWGQITGCLEPALRRRSVQNSFPGPL